jgi:hypothetical protein
MVTSFVTERPCCRFQLPLLIVGQKLRTANYLWHSSNVLIVSPNKQYNTQITYKTDHCLTALSFFWDHWHCTKFGNEVSEFRKIMTSIIQGSGIGPASYVVTASDLHPVTSGNIMDKYADDAYLVIPAVSVDSCAAEIAHVEEWAVHNNLRFNRTKSAEIVFVSPMSKRANVIPSTSCSGNTTRRLDHGPRSDGQSAVFSVTAR